jgi:hypothetical protein
MFLVYFKIFCVLHDGGFDGNPKPLATLSFQNNLCLLKYPLIGLPNCTQQDNLNKKQINPISKITLNSGAVVAQLVEALRYKP